MRRTTGTDENEDKDDDEDAGDDKDGAWMGQTGRGRDVGGTWLGHGRDTGRTCSSRPLGCKLQQRIRVIVATGSFALGLYEGERKTTGTDKGEDKDDEDARASTRTGRGWDRRRVDGT